MPQARDLQTKIGERDVTLRFSWAAITALGDLWGFKTPDETFAKMGEIQKTGIPFDVTGDLLWAALRTHHPDITRPEVEKMLDDHGPAGLPQLLGHLSTAIAGAQPVQEGGTARPLPRKHRG